MLLYLIYSRPWKLKKANRGINQVNAESFTYKWKQCWEVYHRVSGIVAVGIGFIQVHILPKIKISLEFSISGNIRCFLT